MGQPDYYQLLGVSADASAVELEAAYRRMTALFGPDANPEPFAAKIHAAASEAWRVLSDPAQREAYDRLRSRTAAQFDAGWERNGDEAVFSDENVMNDEAILNGDVVLDVEFHEGSPGESTWSDQSGYRAEEAPSSKHHHDVSEHEFIREKDLLEQALSPQFIIVFIASVLCLWLTPWLCYNVLWPSREFGMMIDLSRALVMAVALSAVFWVWMMLLNHVPSFRSLERFLLYTREGKVAAGTVLFVVFFIGAFRYPFVEIPGTVARERNCGWTFTGPRHSIYGVLGGVLPTYNLLVLWVGYRILKRQGVFNPVAEGKSGG